ncbi:type III-A CRISPR-associated RAMP protein Csm3 [Methermicoccus shengliensis]|uniref:CRISPR system Cms endoribonuclease Csm3 n=1 Tax=Methermicoccus shengliensis TaxID=660064 RepID=A0A832RWQ2_9EURY|nr:type III-A CRISPR-associated RAMP protein Csm3 [Methermicoccus shengliensis]MDI3488597.1 CRISPR-associated protein Csm3 [Methanosarcinales archaeon]MDN5294830.1 CRISPR-associated protein Csm3 [Methanosarcinales archaeon]HIH70050.1 type III-A CRISPR-associated RAMP protein Csm3 [Methermicoccus shengliensis]
MDNATLLGKVIVRGKIKAETGLHIGGPSVGLDIGGVDNVVIKDAEEKPYIPGSSLKGKMRSLLERMEGKKPNKNIGGVRIHSCENRDDLAGCNVCKIFGLPADEFSEPTRLIVRDAHLTEESEQMLREANTDLEYTEVKFENAIDRITSAANPRQTERVPAGAEFAFEMVYNVFDEQDKDMLRYVFEAMALLEDDYLGGQGSRGYGKVKFCELKVCWNSKEDYESGNVDVESKAVGYETPKAIVARFNELKSAMGW